MHILDTQSWRWTLVEVSFLQFISKVTTNQLLIFLMCLKCETFDHSTDLSKSLVYDFRHRVKCHPWPITAAVCSEESSLCLEEFFLAPIQSQMAAVTPSTSLTLKWQFGISLLSLERSLLLALGKTTSAYFEVLVSIFCQDS